MILPYSVFTLFNEIMMPKHMFMKWVLFWSNWSSNNILPKNTFSLLCFRALTRICMREIYISFETPTSVTMRLLRGIIVIKLPSSRLHTIFMQFVFRDELRLFPLPTISRRRKFVKLIIAHGEACFRCRTIF